MKRIYLLAALACLGCDVFAQQKTGDSARQFLLIIRYKSDMKMPDAEALKANGQHWGNFIGGLAQSGKLVTGFRPANEGKTITGAAKITKDGVYDMGKDVVSSIFVIKAANMDEAAAIAQKCPIYEMGGSVEIRAVINTAN